jgi:ubiquinone/menaquinone biosynthesis C-methylase UbiE
LNTTPVRENDFPFPSPPGVTARVLWRGDRFQIGDKAVRVLSFGVESSGWTDELTELHEETTGRDHYIDTASRRHALDQVLQVAQPNSVILEVGCSSGYLLEEVRGLMPDARLIGADYTLQTLCRLGDRLPGIPLLHFDLTRCPLPDHSVDVVILINVLEHIEDDNGALSHVFRVLRPGGSAVIEVPAGSHLYDGYDRELMHFRRYDMPDLERKVRAIGFDITSRSHLGFALYPPFLLAKKISRMRDARHRQARKEHVERSIKMSKQYNAVGELLMRAEAALRSRFYLPFGIRCLLTCRRPGAA